MWLSISFMPTKKAEALITLPAIAHLPYEKLTIAGASPRAAYFFSSSSSLTTDTCRRAFTSSCRWTRTWYDLAAIQLDALFGQQSSDVLRGHRTEKLAFLAGLVAGDHRGLGQKLGQFLGAFLLMHFPFQAQAIFILKHSLVFRRSRIDDPSGNQEVAVSSSY